MSKVDNIFIRVVRDEKLQRQFDYDATRYRDLAEGKRSANKYVRAIAEIIELLNSKIVEIKSDMKLKHLSGPVVMNDNDFQAIYKTVVSSLNK